MAYTPNPALITYSTQPVPLSFSLNFPPNADAFGYQAGGFPQDKGAGMRNVFPVKEGDTFVAYTRPSLVTQDFSAGTYHARGVYVWNKAPGTTYYFIATESFMYSSTDGITFSVFYGFGNSNSNRVGFTEFISDVGTKYLIACDGTDGKRITNNSTQVSLAGAGFPSPHVPFPVFIDGYIFLASATTGDIYNSDLNVPATFSAGSFISSELYPDDITALVKINNYLLAIGTTGCEYFYDAANPTASPLARVDGQSLAFGCNLPDSIAANKNACVMITQTNDGESVFRLIEDFKFSDIPSGNILPYINSLITSGTIVKGDIKGSFLRINGDLIYVLTTYNGQPSLGTRNTPTFAFCFGAKIWIELTIGDFPLQLVATAITDQNKILNYINGANPYTDAIYFGSIAASGYAGNSGSYYASDYNRSAGGVTNSTAIVQEIRTVPIDFGTLNRKALHRLGARVYASNKNSLAAALGNYNIQVSYSDDDYQTYSTARDLSIRPLATTSLTTNPVDFPFLTQLGTFRQRIFKLAYSGRAFLKWVRLELDINKGQQ